MKNGISSVTQKVRAEGMNNWRDHINQVGSAGWNAEGDSRRTLQLIAPWVVIICLQPSGKALMERGKSRSVGKVLGGRHFGT
jgi:hypothetical protein